MPHTSELSDDHTSNLGDDTVDAFSHNSTLHSDKLNVEEKAQDSGYGEYAHNFLGMENTSLHKPQPIKQTAVAPALPQRSERRTVRGVEQPLSDRKDKETENLPTATVRMSTAEESDPHESYLSSEEDASITDDDDVSLFDFEDTDVIEEARITSVSRTSSRKSQDFTAKAVSYVAVGKPQIIEIQNPLKPSTPLDVATFPPPSSPAPRSPASTPTANAPIHRILIRRQPVPNLRESNLRINTSSVQRPTLPTPTLSTPSLSTSTLSSPALSTATLPTPTLSIFRSIADFTQEASQSATGLIPSPTPSEFKLPSLDGASKLVTQHEVSSQGARDGSQSTFTPAYSLGPSSFSTCTDLQVTTDNLHTVRSKSNHRPTLDAWKRVSRNLHKVRNSSRPKLNLANTMRIVTSDATPTAPALEENISLFGPEEKTVEVVNESKLKCPESTSVIISVEANVKMSPPIPPHVTHKGDRKSFTINLGRNVSFKKL